MFVIRSFTQGLRVQLFNNRLLPDNPVRSSRSQLRLRRLHNWSWPFRSKVLLNCQSQHQTLNQLRSIPPEPKLRHRHGESSSSPKVQLPGGVQLVLEFPEQSKTLIHNRWNRRTGDEPDARQLVWHRTPVRLVRLIASQEVKDFATLFDGSTNCERDQQMSWFKL